MLLLVVSEQSVAHVRVDEHSCHHNSELMISPVWPTYGSAAASLWLSHTTSSASPHRLTLLRAIHSVGDLTHLVLMFGPHAGETLGKVAQNDIDYLRQLARTAQGADVRAAAARLVAAVPADPPCIES